MKVDYSTTDVIAHYPKFAKPDVYDGEVQGYKTKAELSEAQAKKLMGDISSWMKEKGIAPKGVKMPVAKSDDGTKVFARFRSKFKPLLLNKDGVPIEDAEYMVNHGAVIRIAGAINYDPKNKRIILRPNVVVVIENPEYQGNVDANAIWGDLGNNSETEETADAAQTAAEPTGGEAGAEAGGADDDDDAFAIR